MAMAQAIDSVSREKLFNDGDQNTGKSSRFGSSRLLRQWMDPASNPSNPNIGDESATGSASPLYLICLVISTGGLQVIWTAIMSQGSPYLSSLGLPTYLISLIWLAGPLSGTLVQPCIGVLSDRCQHPLGRRKPFIIVGTIATIICLLAIPRTVDIITLVLPLLGLHIEGPAALKLNRIVASAWIWALTVAIQPVQAGVRALIVDRCPSGQHVQANAYASCTIGLGTVLGYASGFLSLPKVLPFVGNTQFKGLSVVASVALGSTVAVTCLVVEEKRAVWNDEILKSGFGVFKVFGQILSTAKTMPNSIKRVCMVQFFAWLSWFPFLFWATTYVGDLYQAETLSLTTHSGLLQTPIVLRPDSVRQGTFALTLFAITALVSNLFLPLFVSYPKSRLAAFVPRSQSSTASPIVEIVGNEEPTPDNLTEEGFFRPRVANDLSCLKSLFSIPWLTLPRAWTASHILTSVTLLSTVLAHSRIPSIILVSLLGISWAMTQWAPYALISTEIARFNSRSSISTTVDSDDQREHANAERGSLKLEAGAIMGVHNMSIAAPQIIAAVGGSALFWVLGRWGIIDGEAIGWVLRVGGLAGFAAAWLAAGIEKNQEKEEAERVLRGA